jgi:hypothetical protein
MVTMFTSITVEVLLAACIFVGALLYSSVGHAGASAYIAIMALFGVAPVVMRPTALVLNIVVATFASWRFTKAGFFRWRTLWPFIIGAIPDGLRRRINPATRSHLPTTRRCRPSDCRHPLLWPKPLNTDESRDPPILLGILAGPGSASSQG